MPDATELSAPTDAIERPVSRRRALGWIGAAGLTAFAAACGSSSKSTTSGPSPTTTPSTFGTSETTGSATSSTPSGACALTPELTEGPYYIADEAVRRDITEGKDGLPLELGLTVVDATTCAPIPGAMVEVWHADAAGDYSGFGNATSNTTFLRGVQNAGTDGTATFQTLYPGWYQGRATHIHLKVRIDSAEVHTGQLFFDEAVNDEVYATAAYERGGSRTTNAQDSIYRDAGDQALAAVAKAGDGYRVTATLAVRA